MWQQVTRFTDKLAIVGPEVHPRDPKTMWVSGTVQDDSAAGYVGLYKIKQ